jgi:hypothetical protein
VFVEGLSGIKGTEGSSFTFWMIFIYEGIDFSPYNDDEPR